MLTDCNDLVGREKLARQERPRPTAEGEGLASGRESPQPAQDVGQGGANTCAFSAPLDALVSPPVIKKKSDIN